MKSKFFATGIAAAFASTVAGARLFSVAFPRVHWEPVAGMHIHHYVYGIFILTAAGYLALIFKSPRATLWIALMYGLGVGLTFDEFGMWFNPPFVRGVRWNTNGVMIVALAFALMGLLPIIARRNSRPFARARNSFEIPPSNSLGGRNAEEMALDTSICDCNHSTFLHISDGADVRAATQNAGAAQITGKS